MADDTKDASPSNPTSVTSILNEGVESQSSSSDEATKERFGHVVEAMMHERHLKDHAAVMIKTALSDESALFRDSSYAHEVEIALKHLGGDYSRYEFDKEACERLRKTSQAAISYHKELSDTASSDQPSSNTQLHEYTQAVKDLKQSYPEEVATSLHTLQANGWSQEDAHTVVASAVDKSKSGGIHLSEALEKEILASAKIKGIQIKDSDVKSVLHDATKKSVKKRVKVEGAHEQTTSRTIIKSILVQGVSDFALDRNNEAIQVKLDAIAGKIASNQPVDIVVELGSLKGVIPEEKIQRIAQLLERSAASAVIVVEKNKEFHQETSEAFTQEEEKQKNSEIKSTTSGDAPVEPESLLPETRVQPAVTPDSTHDVAVSRDISDIEKTPDVLVVPPEETVAVLHTTQQAEGADKAVDTVTTDQPVYKNEDIGKPLQQPTPEVFHSEAPKQPTEGERLVQEQVTRALRVDEQEEKPTIIKPVVTSEKKSSTTEVVSTEIKQVKTVLQKRAQELTLEEAFEVYTPTSVKRNTGPTTTREQRAIIRETSSTLESLENDPHTKTLFQESVDKHPKKMSQSIEKRLELWRNNGVEVKDFSVGNWFRPFFQKKQFSVTSPFELQTLPPLATPSFPPGIKRFFTAFFQKILALQVLIKQVIKKIVSSLIGNLIQDFIKNIIRRVISKVIQQIGLAFLTAGASLGLKLATNLPIIGQYLEKLEDSLLRIGKIIAIAVVIGIVLLLVFIVVLLIKASTDLGCNIPIINNIIQGCGAYNFQ